MEGGKEGEKEVSLELYPWKYLKCIYINKKVIMGQHSFTHCFLITVTPVTLGCKSLIFTRKCRKSAANVELLGLKSLHFSLE